MPASLWQYLTVLPSVAKEVGYCVSTQSGGQSPRYQNKNITLSTDALYIKLSTFLTHKKVVISSTSSDTLCENAIARTLY